MWIKPCFTNNFNLNVPTDIHFTKEYIAAYLENGDEIFEFEYKKKDKFFKNISIKRAIKKIAKIKINNGYFDLETPYGYGGYLTNTDDVFFIEEALKQYSELCIKNKIIAEFLRFHPFNTFPEKYNNFLDFCVPDRKIVYVDLSGDYAEIWRSYASSLRGNIRKAENLGLKYKQLPSICRSNFIERYYQTMRKKKAERFYFFNRNYFGSLDKIKYVKLYCTTHQDARLNYIVMLESYPFVYYHLAATNFPYYSFNPNAFILDKLIKLYKKKNFNFLFLGGGKSGRDDDSLYRFKTKFSCLRKKYHIGGKTFMPDIYQKYVALWESKKKGGEYPSNFLRYRLEV